MSPRSVYCAVLLALGASSPPRVAAFTAPRSSTGSPNTCSSASCIASPSPKTRLHAKNPDRARMERELEDLMDRDWRAFRAHLVMNEATEAKEAAAADQSANGINGSADGPFDERLDKQNTMGNLFAGAISSIFRSNKEAEEQAKVNALCNENDDEECSIFDGDAVGGATAFSTLPNGVLVDDPFLSEAELPAVVQPKNKLDKHRWAHSVSFRLIYCSTHFHQSFYIYLSRWHK